MNFQGMPLFEETRQMRMLAIYPLLVLVSSVWKNVSMAVTCSETVVIMSGLL